MVRLVPVGMVVAEGTHLLVGDAGDPLAGGKAERCTPETRDRLDIVLAVVVEHPDAFASVKDRRTDLAVAAKIGLRVHLICDVPRGSRIRQHAHVNGSFC